MEFDNVTEATAYFNFLNDIQSGYKDISIDNYTVNVLGINDYIVLDDVSMLPTSQNNPKLKVEYWNTANGINGTIINWSVTDEYGVQYFFGDFNGTVDQGVEKTTFYNFNDIDSAVALRVGYKSSWLLTKIISPNGKDIYEFEYQSTGYWQQPVNTHISKVINIGYTNQNEKINNFNSYHINQQVLTQVKHNDQVIISLDLHDRDDLDVNSSRVKSISVNNPIDGSIVKHFEFSQSYFGTNTNGGIEELRLKLDEIGIAGKGYDGSTGYDFKKKYQFEYDRPEEMPRRDSFAQDILGYYNDETGNDLAACCYENPPCDGCDQNQKPLYPQVTIPKEETPLQQDFYLGGANRTFNEDKAKIGILNKISYPTKGFSEFEYEKHENTVLVPIQNEQNYVVTEFRVSDKVGDSDLEQCGNSENSINIKSTFIKILNTGNYNIEFDASPYASEYKEQRAYIIRRNNNYETYNYENICTNQIDPTLLEYSFANGDSGNEVFLDEGYYQVFITCEENTTQLNRQTKIKITGNGFLDAGLIYEDSVSNLLEVFPTTECGTCCMDESELLIEGNPTPGIYVETGFIQITDPDAYYKFTLNVAGEFLAVPTSNLNFNAYVIGPFSDTSISYTYEDICLDNIGVLYKINKLNSLENFRYGLEIGYYQIIITNTSPSWNGSSTVTLTIEKEELITDITPEYETVTTIYPGLRIKSITDYTEASEIATKKSFDYTNSLVENYKPISFYKTTQYTLDDAGHENTTPVFHRLTNTITGSQPYITYTKVIEKVENPITGNAEIGYVEHNFFNNHNEPKGAQPNDFQPFVTEYYTNLIKGSIEKKSVYNASDQLLNKSENEYATTETNLFVGFTTEDVPIRSYKYVQLYHYPPNTTNKVRFRYVNGIVNGSSLNPPDCNNGDDIHCLQTQSFSRINPQRIYNHTQNLESKQNITTQVLNGNETVQTTNLTFIPSINYQLRESETTISNQGESLITRYYYPKDYPSENQMSELIAANRISEPVQTKIYNKDASNGSLNEELLSSQKISYIGLGNSMILPELIETAKGTNSLKVKMKYHEYDDYGNPLEVSREGGTHTVYIWGYNNTLPVAKIENATLSDIPTTLIDYIHTLSSGTTNTSLSLLTKLTELRNLPQLQKAMVTTMTYIPMIGVSTITDPRGAIQYYEYDDLNRLKFVKDANDKILSENEYHYKN